MSEEIEELKKQRATIKSNFTKLKNYVKQNLKPQNIEVIKDKVQRCPELIASFEDVHAKLSSKLSTEEIEDAVTYRVSLIADIEEFEQYVHAWLQHELEDEEKDNTADEEAIIERSTDSVVNPDSELSAPEISLEERQLENAKALERMQRINGAERLQKETAALNQQARQKALALEKEKLQDKITSQQEERKMQEEIERLQREVKRLTNGDGDNPAATSDDISPIQKSTPQPRSSQVSWDPSSRPAEESMKMLVCELLKESRQQQQSVVDALQLPRRELQSFNGDPLRYWSFIQSFKANVDKRKVDDAAKLSVLLQNCVGPARKMLYCTELMAPETGYKRALEILEERYGDKFEISQKWVEKILNRTIVKGPVELRDFADELLCCEEMLRSMGHLSDLNNPTNMRAIWRKLPQYLQDRWAHRNHQIKKKEGKGKADLRDLVEFVVEAAEEATDPVFSRLSSSDPKKKSINTHLATVCKKEINPGNRKCPCCGEPHYITQCTEFKAMKVGERRNLVMRRGLCMNCFAKGHLCRNCPQQFTCSIDGCGLKHSKFLHINRQQTDVTPTSTSTFDSRQQQQQIPQQQQQQIQQQQQPHKQSHFVGSTSRLAMPIVPARVYNKESGMYKDTYALLDPGSTGTYCAESLKNELNVPGVKQSMELTTLTAVKMPVSTTVVRLDVANKNHGPTFEVEAVVRPNLNIDAANMAMKLDLGKWPHLWDLDIPEFCSGPVELLIGQDSSALFAPEDIRRGRIGEPFALQTPLGWAINGPINPEGQRQHSSHFVQIDKQALLNKDLKTLWDIEDANKEDVGWSRNDESVMNIWNESVKVEEGHYIMKIPFKHATPKLPNNRSLAEKRLSTLNRRLAKDEKLKVRYAEEIHKLLKEGYAEQVPMEEIERNDGKVYYLPHHPVHNPKKPEKCRLVFDCAARYGGSSLNDHVHQGPDLANSLIGVLLRFRQGDTGFMADIEGMFHQVLVTRDDRDVLRFLWCDEESPDPKTYRMKSHLFGGIWSPSCANFALKKVGEEFSSEYGEEIAEILTHNFYVDDCLYSSDYPEATVTAATQVKELLARRGFNLTKYVSPSREVMRRIPEKDWGKSLQNLDLDSETLPTEKALGMLWNLDTDGLGFDIQKKETPETKRGVLSSLSAVYDPLGYISPVILPARRIFQQMCREEKGWDEPMNPATLEKWAQWKDSLALLNDFSLPRCIKQSAARIKEAEIHHFSDASEKAYGAVSYLRMILDDDTISTGIIMAKSRLAPIKGSTIPRLELAGALEAVRLDKILRRELTIELKPSKFWTDSQIVLWYLNSPNRRFQTYVSNRVAKIVEHTELKQWRYVPTGENPGDDCSRGLAARDLIKNHRWLYGPSFLQKDEDEWPEQPTLTNPELESQAELKCAKDALAGAQEIDHTNRLLCYYSSWWKLKRAVVWYRKFQQFLQGKEAQAAIPISVDEMKDAETAILQHVQKSLPEKGDQLKKLSPITDNGLKRVGGRLANSSFTQDTMHPIILPSTHHVSELITRDSHDITGHAGVERVLAETRKRYWILKGRKLVKRVVHKCIRCRRNFGKMEAQQMANLPESRLTPYEPPFTCVGIDYFGPFPVKRGRADVKRYGCIFSCFTSRAVHIEVAHSLSTHSFLQALDRFIARRGEPREIWSDNGTNFVGASQELKKTIREWNQSQINEHLIKREIDWHFIPPTASHMGGVWERLIRNVRKVLLGVMTQQCIDDEELVTLLTIVEGIVNSRPLTKLSDDPRDASPLTPNHLLMLCPGQLLPAGKFDDRDMYRGKWKKIQYLSNLFWKRWLKEYIPRLQERGKWLEPRRNMRAGNLVLISQPTTPRRQWPLGLIIEAHESTDGLVRTVRVQTSSGVYERPVAKLCLLEGV